MADNIIEFIERYKNSVDTLLIYCHAGQSRSKAVGTFVIVILVGDNSRCFEEGKPNQYIYDVLETAWVRRQLAKM